MKKILLIIPALFCFLACTPSMGKSGKEDNGGTAEDINNVTVNFFNESSFKTAIYMNVNPSSSDTSAKPLLTLPAGAQKDVKLPASADSKVGDVFYIRYFVQFADALTSGTGEPLYIQAERDISNIAFVLKKNKTYTKTISQPAHGQLKFVQCCIKIQNTGSKSFQVLQGSTYLKKLGTEEFNLASGEFGFYELHISDIETAEMMSALKILVTDTANTITVAPFLLECGKIYGFQCNGTSVTAPTVTDIAY